MISPTNGPAMYHKVDWTGRTINSWTILGWVRTNTNYNKVWWCRCACGIEKEVFAAELFRHDRDVAQCQSCTLSIHSNRGSVRSFYLTCVYANALKRKISVLITIDDLNTVWNRQQGLCSLSGRALILKKTSNEKGTTASVDRIDSSKPYTLDNIQWVHIDINLAKQQLSQLDFIALCRDVTVFRKEDN